MANKVPGGKSAGVPFLQNVCARLAVNKRVRRTLPFGGRLHIDRQLPFLCVYRRPEDHSDQGTERLLMGEASYLTASGRKQDQKRLSALAREVVSTLSPNFGAFLLVEIWDGKNEANGGEPPPPFRVFVSKADAETPAIERFERALRQVRVTRRPAAVEVFTGRRTCPPGLSPLISKQRSGQLNLQRLGLEIPPVYRDSQTGELFPLELRALHRGLARAFKQLFYEFARTQTTHFPPHYLSLGRRAVVKAVWEVDRQLAEVNDAFEFLLLLTPTNAEEAWRRFRRGRCERVPRFAYRPLPVEPSLLKRDLFKIRIERIEDPVIADLFREKQRELDRQISLLADRGGARFLYGSMQLYGQVSPELEALAKELLERLPARTREDSGQQRLDAEMFAQRVREEIDYYREAFPDFAATAEVRPDVTGLLSSKGRLLIGAGTHVPAPRTEALVQHEVGTHLLTYFNGKAQPFRQLYTGLAGYDELQEGLAVLSEYLVGGLSVSRMRILAARVLAVCRLVEGASFVDTFRELDRAYDFEQRTAFSVTMRVYRGGGLTKDAVYLSGLVKLLAYLKNGASIEPLFVGKINTTHIRIVKELRLRQVLRPVAVRPRYMDYPQTETRLQKLRELESPMQLIDGKQKK